MESETVVPRKSFVPCRWPPIVLACVVAFAATGARGVGPVEWKPGRNAVCEGDRIVVDTHGSRDGGAAHATIDLGGATGGVRATIRARGAGIGRPDKSWFGLKFMLRYVDPATRAVRWPQADHRGGDFDWTTLVLETDLGPEPVGEIDVTLGLQNVEGRVEFDLSSFEIGPCALYEFPRHNPDYKVAYPARVTGRPQLRGAMLPIDPTEDDVRTLASWGGTVARFQMSRNFQKIDANLDFDEYGRWLDGRLDLLEKVLGWAREVGMKICVDLHVPPGSVRDNAETRMFSDGACLDLYVRCWEKIAARLKGNEDVVYGYDLLNEPHQNRHEVPVSYWDAQRLAAEAIRRIDPETTIVMEANLSSSAPAYEYLSPLAMPNVVYELHMYVPSEYTHQGVTGGWSEPRRWPDESRGWNKEMLRERLAPVVAFAKRHDARIFVGEFSAVAWAEGADRYLRDCIELFDEYGWDWCYHAFNEWRGWNVEYEGDSLASLRRTGYTARKRALLDGLSRGEPPAYCDDWLRGVAAKVRDRAAASDDSFFFLTDLHVPANAGVSGRILARLVGETGVRKVLCGGDMPEAFGGKESIDATVAAYREQWVDAVERAGGEFYPAKGNHDFTIRESMSSTNGYTYPAREARDILMDTAAVRARAVTNADDPTACYYYVDFPERKIRYVVADTTDSVRTDRAYWAVKYGMGDTQLRWLAENALATLPDGWAALVMNHIPIARIVNCEWDDVPALLAPWRNLLEAYQNRGRAAVAGREYDFSAARGFLLCDLTGHEHAERQTFQRGLWHVTQPSDAAYTADYRYGSAPWCEDLPARRKGSVHEQNFDAVHVDLRNRALRFTRIGGGADRTFHLDPVRVRVGETVRLAAEPGFAVAKWACYDADRVQVSPHPDNKWQKRYRYFDDVGDISPDGVFTAKKPGESVVLAIAPDGAKELFAVECEAAPSVPQNDRPLDSQLTQPENAR